MNILHVIAAPAAGGAEVYVKDLAVCLAGKGHQVHIGFLGHAEEIGRDRGFEERYVDELQRAGIRYFFVGNAARRMPWVGVSRVSRYVKQHEIEIYHAHLTYGVIFGALLQVPRVYTHHNIRMRMHRAAFRLVGRCTDGLIGISRICAKALADFSGRDVTTIHNGVDVGRFDGLANSTRSIGDRVKCLAVGQVSRQKNYPMLLTAIAMLPAGLRSRIKLTIVGDGARDDIAEIESLVAKLKLADTVELLGHRDDIPSLMHESQLFLMSSDYEGLPIALIEAAISGLPSIVTDVGGCRELIDICGNGVVVEANNPTAFAEAVVAALGDPQQFSEYSANALSRSGVFDIKAAADAHLKLYRDRCAAGSRA